MADGVHISTGNLLDAAELASAVVLKHAPNSIRYASFGDTKLADPELDRVVQAVPKIVAAAMKERAFYFVPLALPEGFGSESNATVPASATEAAHEGVFISARLLRDQFALAFEFFINVGHAFAAEAGIPEAFTALSWAQATADVRGETSQDAWESRAEAVAGTNGDKSRPDEKARSEFFESAFADAIAIYLLSLAVDFDYSELREREYPLLAPSALADRLRLMAHLFPPNPGYEFSIRYRRRA